MTEPTEIDVWPEDLQVGDTIMVPVKITALKKGTIKTPLVPTPPPVECYRLKLASSYTNEDWVGFSVSGDAVISAHERQKVIREL